MDEEFTQHLAEMLKNAILQKVDKDNEDLEPLGQVSDEVVAIFKKSRSYAEEAGELMRRAEHFKKKGWMMVEEAVGIYSKQLRCDWEGDRVIYLVKEKKNDS